MLLKKKAAANNRIRINLANSAMNLNFKVLKLDPGWTRKVAYTSVATESWSGLNSFPLGKCRYKLFIERLSKGVFNILVRLVG